MTADVASARRDRVLVVSYAFPPMQIQMAPIVAKPMAGLKTLGYDVDVVCVEPFSRYLGRDDSLSTYITENFCHVYRLRPPRALFDRIRLRLPVVATTPDLMTILRSQAYRLLMSLDLEKYQAIISWSPFHSVNPVMVKLKKARPGIRWIAQFSDPWAGNPLVHNDLTKLWAKWQEPLALEAADFVIHSSRFTLDLMAKNSRGNLIAKSAVIAHPFDATLFPRRQKVKNSHIILRYVGVLFDRRSPEPVFQALNILFAQKPELKGLLQLELVGAVPSWMLETAAAKTLPEGTVTHFKSVSYLESLEKMYDADILLLIEADVKENLFVPSKLSDYMGANTPIVGIASPGGSWDVLKALGCWCASPADIKGISYAIEEAVLHIYEGAEKSWCNDGFRLQYSRDMIAAQFVEIIANLKRDT